VSINKAKFLKLETNLSELQAMIDDIDVTKFGNLDKLFDEMARSVADATSMASDLEYQIDWEAEASA
jgi:hypothetical protein